MCQQLGRDTEATVVDHIEPHNGDRALFWDSQNWQALCALCHDAHKQRLEKTGRVTGGDVLGQPLDPDHHWNK